MTPYEPTVAPRTERAVKLTQGEPLDTHGERRRCIADGCDTVLSRYNPDSVCKSHGGWRPQAEDHSKPRRRQARRSSAGARRDATS